MTKSIHWGELKIDGHFNITGRGEVVTTEINIDLFKFLPPYKIGDTFTYKGQLCEIRGLECFKDLLRGYLRPNIGIQFKIIEQP